MSKFAFMKKNIQSQRRAMVDRSGVHKIGKYYNKIKSNYYFQKQNFVFRIFGNFFKNFL